MWIRNGVFVYGLPRGVCRAVFLSGIFLLFFGFCLLFLLRCESLEALYDEDYGDEIDISKLRYHKIVIMTDADVDGQHISTLMLTFLYRYFKPLIEGGYVYSAMPPLYKLFKGQKTLRYCYTDEELELAKRDFGDEKYDIQRYKGVGEMDASQLWETTLDPAHRTLKRVSIEDAIDADQVFSMLMGDEVEPRKNFIVENAHFAKNLDL